ncbi:hypothetical protein VTK73DRAFT_3497 [Phialemonium thermophilum]|uniref:Phytase-like domain-containing protein n=1 Tax=Phialemonium thermophilum TaxID=223376 RepID=A0ABR3VIT5_9PEZI
MRLWLRRTSDLQGRPLSPTRSGTGDASAGVAAHVQHLSTTDYHHVLALRPSWIPTPWCTQEPPWATFRALTQENVANGDYAAKLHALEKEIPDGALRRIVSSVPSLSARGGRTDRLTERGGNPRFRSVWLSPIPNSNKERPASLTVVTIVAIVTMVAFQRGILALSGLSAALASTCPPSVVNTTTCNGKRYVYNGLSGYGFVPSNARDKYGDTISIGSSLSIESWVQKGGRYEGVLYGLPDRGWNTEGTLNFQPRIHKYAVTLTPVAASLARPARPNLEFRYLDTILLYGPDGRPATGLDADADGYAHYPGFPVLPVATYTGDGFGGPGPGGRRIPIDAEALVLSRHDGGFWISDEYGPYVYKFDKKGKMVLAIAPPDAILPLRNGSVR